MHETKTVMLTTHDGRRPAPVLVPARVGSVRVGDLLGEGGGGAVFTGYDEALGRSVAVKVLHRQVGPAASAAQQELIVGVRTAARVKHANIVTVHTVEMVGTMPVIVMEYVDGLSLAQILQRTGPLELSLGLFVMDAVASAVAALHDEGVIHRDIKPANVLFDRDGVAHVCDFGLACARPAGAFGTDVEQVGGSPLYMAPEVFDGQASTQGDVYALGVTLFETLTGAAPFWGDTVEEVRAQHLRAEPPLHMLARRKLPEALSEVLRRALHKQRFLRYKTAGHLLRALREVPAPLQRPELLRTRLAQTVATARDGSAGPARSEAVAPHAMTTFDLVAERARQKRRMREQ